MLRRERQERRYEKRKQLYRILAKYTKYLLILPALPLVLLVIYGLYWLARLMLAIINNWEVIVSTIYETLVMACGYIADALIPALIILVISAILIATSIAIVKIMVKCKFNISDLIGKRINRPPRQDSHGPSIIDKLGIKVYNMFDRICEKIYDVLSFFSMYIKAFKENNCPSIEWEEKK